MKQIDSMITGYSTHPPLCPPLFHLTIFNWRGE